MLKTAWSAVSKMDTHFWFKDPVTEVIAPGYHKVINMPMDLSTILKKVQLVEKYWSGIMSSFFP